MTRNGTRTIVSTLSHAAKSLSSGGDPSLRLPIPRSFSHWDGIFDNKKMANYCGGVTNGMVTFRTRPKIHSVDLERGASHAGARETDFSRPM